MRFIVLIPADADAITGPYGEYKRLEPRQIAAGEQAPNYALPVTILDDDELPQATREFLLLMGAELDLDPEVCWPPQPEPEPEAA